MTITNGADLTPRTTFGIPAKCSCLIEYDSVDDLHRLYALGMLADVFPIGGGSNLLFVEPEFSRTVITSRMADIQEIIGTSDCSEDYVFFRIGAGASLEQACLHFASLGLWGMENLYGIPGSVGGAAVQNAGAYGAEMSQVVLTVNAFDPSCGAERSLSTSECAFAYRDSIFKHDASKLIITSVDVRLARHSSPNLHYPAVCQALAEAMAREGVDSPSPLLVAQAVQRLRSEKLPAVDKVGSAGSFFKNPVVSAREFDSLRSSHGDDVPGHSLPDGRVKLSAAWLIDHAGCKPLKVGGASVWQKQPLVIVNERFTARGSDVVELEEAIVNAVENKYHVKLTPEVIHLY